MKNIHQNWEPDAFMQRLPSSASQTAISRPLLNKGEGRSRCPATTGVWRFSSKISAQPHRGAFCSSWPSGGPSHTLYWPEEATLGITNIPQTASPACCIRTTCLPCCHEAECYARVAGPGLSRKHAVISLQILPNNTFISKAKFSFSTKNKPPSQSPFPTAETKVQWKWPWDTTIKQRKQHKGVCLSNTIVGEYSLIMPTKETKSTYQLTLGCISTVLTGCN